MYLSRRKSTWPRHYL